MTQTTRKPAIAYQHSAMNALVHCATNSISGWGSKRRVWAAFAYTGAMITWSANKRACKSAAERQAQRFFICKLQGIET